MGGTRGDRAGATGAIPAQLAAMWMWLRGSRRVAEEVVGEAEPGAQTLSGRLEHMFGSLRQASDGTDQIPSYDADPIEDQISSFLRTRSITASVNSAVPAWPPRSGVFLPDATVSRAPS
jgi:hypothetical protein